MKYSSAIPRFLTSDTQIQLKILCREPSANTNNVQGQIEKDLRNYYGKTKVQINGRIGRIVGCLPSQSDACVFSNTSSSKHNEYLQFIWYHYYYYILWKQMKQKTFKMVVVDCEYAGELYIDECSNITGPEISREKVTELRQDFLNQEIEQITANQKNETHLQRVAKETKMKSNNKKTLFASVLKKQTINQLRTWADGFYFIELSRPVFIDSNAPKPHVDVIVSMKNRHGGYITPDEYPSFVFYSAMFRIYVFCAILWFISCALLIIIGMIEKLALFLEYDGVNKYGYNVHFAVTTTEVISCLRRTVLRMLVIIVLLGYGIVKLSLGLLKKEFNNAFWHLLSLLILLVIMFLYRPLSNSQLYVFVPLLDELDNDNDDEEKRKSGVFDSITIYNGTSTQDGAASKCQKQQKTSVNHEANVSSSGTGGSIGNYAVKDVLAWTEHNMPTRINNPIK
ncbi:unnamed protein product [Rotaria sp. Silwood2]|nr:unnamed protein product [Rotaria sp. Silwood2]